MARIERNTLASVVSYLMGGAIMLRGYLTHPDQRPQMLPLLLIMAVLLLSDRLVLKRDRWLQTVYILLKVGIVIALFSIVGNSDVWSILLLPTSIFVMRSHPERSGWLWVTVFIAMMCVMLFIEYGVYAPPLILPYIAVFILIGSYALMLRETSEAQQKSQALVVQLRETNQQLRAYANRVEELTAIKERNRLARDLHDSVTQTIFSMTLITRTALILAEKDPEQVPARLTQLNDLAQGALTEMRTLISQLRPVTVADDGLIEALQRHIDELNKQQPTQITLRVEPDEPDIDTTEAQELYRIIQEALNNIIKHAQADHASIQIEEAADHLTIQIRDDGVGFDPATLMKDHRHFGLDSMQERAEELQAQYKLISTPRTGTTITIQLPRRPDRGTHGSD